MLLAGLRAGGEPGRVCFVQLVAAPGALVGLGWVILSEMCWTRCIMLDGSDRAEGKLLSKLPNHFLFQIALFYYAQMQLLVLAAWVSCVPL